MLWTASWLPTSAASTILVIAVILAWAYVDRSKAIYLNLLAATASIVLFGSLNPDLAQKAPSLVYRAVIDVANFLRLEYLLEYHASMLITGAAFVWLAHRAWQTLWKPVPELIGVLGVDVPDAPDVSLAGIRADAATLNWTRPRANRPVAKFLIQVNGVNVGESANLETAITVTGLKPDHFYNVRVIAVGYNNFQAGSKVIRLRTFTRDGRPQLGDGRLPSNFVLEEQQHIVSVEDIDEDGIARNPAAGVETAVIPESPAQPPRDATSGASGTIGRRNTLTRKHSPSTASIEAGLQDLENIPNASLQDLSKKFEAIRNEIEDIQFQIAKDEKENKELTDELTEEKKLKKRELKEKDDMTEKLKREVGSTDRAMRSAQQRKTQREKSLKERQNERKKLEDEMAKWDKDMASMAKRQATFDKDKITIQENGDSRSEELRTEIATLQANYAQDEQELREKGKDLKEAEEQRKKLPGGEESEEWRETDRQIRRDWEMRARDLQRRLFASNKKLRMVSDYGLVLQKQVNAAQQSGLPMMYNQPMGAPGFEQHAAPPNHMDQANHLAQTDTSAMPNTAVPSPTANFSQAEPFQPSLGFGPISRAPTLPPGFVQGPFLDAALDFSNPLDEDGFRALTAGAPLSPTAQALLPAGMLDDALDDDDDDVFEDASYSPQQAYVWRSGDSPDAEARSPASSPQSTSLVSSPQGSSQHLPFPPGLRGDPGITSSPLAPSTRPKAQHSYLSSWLHRGPKSGADEPPALGSLKPAQSQSFPRQGDGDLPSAKRRISLTTGWGTMFNRNSVGPEILDHKGSPRGVPASRLGLGSNTNIGIFADRDPSSPRPGSIASQELPRPSTDSGSIWGRPLPNRIWAAEDNPWASRNPSRRPSIHGSPSALKTTLADADDEILDDAELLNASPSQVGVIGTRPTSKSLSQRLNPNAPSFMGAFFRPRGDRSDNGKDSKSKSRDKDATKEKKLRESIDATRLSVDESMSMDSRQSRDALSVNTPSISESRESLSLDQPFSNTYSESAVGLALKDQDNTFKKLLRKGSSSKFSLSSVGRNFSSKKGPSSVSNSEKNAPLERASFEENLEDSGFLGRSHESANNSPLIGTPPIGSKKDKAGGGWGSRFTMKKKPGREKESLDLDRNEPIPISPGSEDK